MINFKCCGLVLGAFLQSVSSFASDESLNKKPITIKSIPYELHLDNQLGEVKINADKIEITALKGTDLFTNTTGEKNADNSPRLLFVPEGDFIFSAKVSAAFAETPYDGGALIVYVDSKNWGKLLFERFKSGKIGIATTVSKGSGDDAYHGTRDTNPIFENCQVRLVLCLLHIGRWQGLEFCAPFRVEIYRSSPFG